ncbi:DNA polymerase III subunit delta, partial [Thermodesulfobacteriota bacterium]
PRALETMYNRSGKDIRRLQSEVEKLVGYLGTRKQITVEDVERLFGDFHEAAFYEFNTAVRSADLGRCLVALHENLRIVDHPLQTLASLANEIRKLMVARELLFTVFQPHWKRGMSYNRFKQVVETVREENPHMMEKGRFNLLTNKEYPIYLALKDSQKFSMERLIGIMQAIHEVDVMFKSSRIGSVSPASLMEGLVMKICRPG